MKTSVAVDGAAQNEMGNPSARKYLRGAALCGKTSILKMNIGAACACNKAHPPIGQKPSGVAKKPDGVCAGRYGQ